MIIVWEYDAQNYNIKLLIVANIFYDRLTNELFFKYVSIFRS